MSVDATLTVAQVHVISEDVEPRLRTACPAPSS
jgi:hypothetical protein